MQNKTSACTFLFSMSEPTHRQETEASGDGPEKDRSRDDKRPTDSRLLVLLLEVMRRHLRRGAATSCCSAAPSGAAWATSRYMANGGADMDGVTDADMRNTDDLLIKPADLHLQEARRSAIP